MEIKRPLTHPGDILLDMFLDPTGMTIQELSNDSGVSEEKLRAVMQLNEDITEEIAEGLHKAFGNTKEFWLRMQHQYNDHVKKHPEYYRS